MKVLDLHCGLQHLFEGWFASEDEFQAQRERGQVACPLCGDASITKRLSAPRLNLGSARAEEGGGARAEVAPAAPDPALQAAWLALARRILVNTDDVGHRFAEEARRIHYGEVEVRAIRGQASRADTEALLEEGIAVLPLPEALKETLQ